MSLSSGFFDRLEDWRENVLVADAVHWAPGWNTPTHSDVSDSDYDYVPGQDSSEDDSMDLDDEDNTTVRPDDDDDNMEADIEDNADEGDAEEDAEGELEDDAEGELEDDQADDDGDDDDAPRRGGRGSKAQSVCTVEEENEDEMVLVAAYPEGPQRSDVYPSLKRRRELAAELDWEEKDVHEWYYRHNGPRQAKKKSRANRKKNARRRGQQQPRSPSPDAEMVEETPEPQEDAAEREAVLIASPRGLEAAYALLDFHNWYP